ncbi:hypothetical protein SO802_015802 [Lithocarpus litseifolius]|uniref:F-box domain-containing protein n=1 Tax=Lithocarpus litseifolius TaxID=425828 RepID=A0AAW2CV87_9ROSI
MSDYMPTEVVVDILSRLPVKTLIRFRCVSKTWFSLISTHDFITMHLNRTLSNTKDPPYLLFRHFNEETEKENFAFLSYEDPFPDDHFSKHPNFVNPKPYWQHFEFFDYPSDFIELHCPYKSSNEFWFIVGISNGLVCMVDDTPSNTPYDIVPILWNPSIHKSVFLPSPGVRLPSSYEPMEYLGFGYDPITGDYKVVRLVYLHGWDERSFQGEEPSVVQIYSLRTNAWRTIPGPGHRYIIKEQSLSVFVNGSVHWLAHVGNVDTDSEDDYSDDDPPCNVIFTFNIRDEDFRKMDVPKYYEDTFDLNMMVALVGDKLALVPGNFNLWSSKACYSVWVMKDYGLAESWTKLYNIRIGPDLENVVGFAKNEVIVNKYGTLLSYNPRKRERSDPGIEALSTSLYMDTYMESLVLLNVEGNALRKQAKSSTASKGTRAKVKRKRKVGVSFKQAGKGSAGLMQRLMLKPRKSRKREGSATRTHTLQTGESSSKQMKKGKNKTKEVA